MVNEKVNQILHDNKYIFAKDYCKLKFNIIYKYEEDEYYDFLYHQKLVNISLKNLYKIATRKVFVNDKIREYRKKLLMKNN